MMVVVAEHRQDRDRAGAQILGQRLGLGHGAVVGQVAAQAQHVGHLADLGQRVAPAARVRRRGMDVADGRDAQRAVDDMRFGDLQDFRHGLILRVRSRGRGPDHVGEAP